MNDDAETADDRLPPHLAVALSREDVWHDVPAALTDSVVTAVRDAATPTPIRTGRTISERRTVLPWWLAAAAALAVVVAGVVVIGRSGDDERLGVTVALAATELAPGASATAVFTATPAGLKIVLDADDLPGAADDEMYETWISDGDITVSAGSFHLRGGDPPIELWAGTADPAFRIVTVTIEPIDGVAESSGRVVLRGEYDLSADQ